MPALGPPKLIVGPVFRLFGCGDAVERLQYSGVESVETGHHSVGFRSTQALMIVSLFCGLKNLYGRVAGVVGERLSMAQGSLISDDHLVLLDCGLSLPVDSYDGGKSWKTSSLDEDTIRRNRDSFHKMDTLP